MILVSKALKCIYEIAIKLKPGKVTLYEEYAITV